ncbi:MAG TPA: (2Fe-2S)-binding protein [Firmicutes bacterium]|nr:(2Fe-2S)-binding protein [Bacillota bacterium]
MTEASTHHIRFTLNGSEVSADVKANDTLLNVLREQLGYTGTKRGCETGECGACTVLVDGKAVNACLILAPKVDGRAIQTIEGLAKGAELHPLQKAFIEEGALQCGFCGPGMLMSAKALLDEIPNPTEDQVRRGISGNICRCTGYAKIVKAIMKASRQMARVGGEGA